MKAALLAMLVVAGCSSSTAPPERSHRSAAGTENTITGKVVSIADGDTLTVLVDKTQHRVRLHGIDCPEIGQPFGARAKQLAGDLAFGKVVSVEVTGQDRYGRTIGRVILPDGSNLEHALVGSGLAWWYRKYAPDDTRLGELETAARTAKKGLWADANPIPPWEWRRKPGARAATKKSRGPYWLNTSSNVRHNSGCRYYKKSTAGKACGPNDGKACGICGG